VQNAEFTSTAGIPRPAAGTSERELRASLAAAGFEVRALSRGEAVGAGDGEFLVVAR
jgi:hypothetical protein